MVRPFVWVPTPVACGVVLVRESDDVRGEREIAVTRDGRGRERLSQCATYEGLASTRATYQTRPAVKQAAPAASTGRKPTRFASLPAGPATTATTSGPGVTARPARMIE